MKEGFDFDTCARASNDVTVLIGSLREMMDRHPPATNGHGVLAFPAEVTTDLEKAHQAIGAALATMKKTKFPLRADYEAAQQAAAGRR